MEVDPANKAGKSKNRDNREVNFHQLEADEPRRRSAETKATDKTWATTMGTTTMTARETASKTKSSSKKDNKSRNQKGTNKNVETCDDDDTAWMGTTAAIELTETGKRKKKSRGCCC